MSAPRHGEVFRAPGCFAGWPANYGLWIFDDGEMVLCFTVGSLARERFDDRFHLVDKSKPFTTRQARSLDGGTTWKTAPMPATTPGGRGLSADEHMLPGQGLRVAEAIAAEPMPPCPGGIPFTHPDFALMCARDGLGPGCASFFYWSTDRCHSWHGPFSLPSFGQTGLAARTDCIVLGPHSALLMLTANKQDGKEGRVCAVRTDDGGTSFQLSSFVSDEPPTGHYQIMPASVRLPSTGTIITATRTTIPATIVLGGQTYDKGFCVQLFRSQDDGASFQPVHAKLAMAEKKAEHAEEADDDGSGTPTGVSRSGNPPTLTLLPDGRLGKYQSCMVSI